MTVKGQAGSLTRIDNVGMHGAIRVTNQTGDHCLDCCQFGTQQKACCKLWCCAVLCCPGITESFVHAVLEPSALKAANALLVVFTASHVVCSIVLVQLGGAAGLVAADALNMTLRIAYSLW